MKIVFEPGDKLYKQQYTQDEFFKLRTEMILTCIQNNWCFSEEKEDDFCCIKALSDVDTIGTDYEIARGNKINLMDVVKDQVLSQPLMYDGYYFDCDFNSIVRIKALVSYMKRNDIAFVDWVDTRNNLKKDVPLKVFEGILNLYSDKVFQLNNVCFKFVYEMDKCKTVDDVFKVSMDELCKFI